MQPTGSGWYNCQSVLCWQAKERTKAWGSLPQGIFPWRMQVSTLSDTMGGVEETLTCGLSNMDHREGPVSQSGILATSRTNVVLFRAQESAR